LNPYDSNLDNDRAHHSNTLTQKPSSIRLEN